MRAVNVLAFGLLTHTISDGTENERGSMLTSSNFIRASLQSRVAVTDLSESSSVTAYRRLSKSDK